MVTSIFTFNGFSHNHVEDYLNITITCLCQRACGTHGLCMKICRIHTQSQEKKQNEDTSFHYDDIPVYVDETKMSD